MKALEICICYAAVLVSSQLILQPQYIEPPATIAGFRSVGCYSDNSYGQRTLKDSSLSDDAMTLDLCAKTCSNSKYWGVEYGRECYCGNTLTERTTQKLASACDHKCSGNASQPCGAGNTLNIFEKISDAPTLPPTTPRGVGDFYHFACLKDSTGTRRLQDSGHPGRWGPDITVQMCAKICDGSEYFGLEYSRECFCGNKLDMRVDLPETPPVCAMMCAGNVSEFCGDANQISVYRMCRLSTGQVGVGSFCVV